MKSPDIITAITGVRIRNNDLWMEILRIAARYAPTETADLLAKVAANDATITGMTKGLEETLRREAVDDAFLDQR